MISVDWNGYFKLPDAALAGYKRIPKTVLTRQAQLTKHEQKALDKVAGLWHFATVQKSTTRILPHVDDERDVQSVVFLYCELAGGSRAFAEVAALLHKCFPNPTVIAFDSAGVSCVSVALTRKSLAEAGAVVVGSVESTGAFSVSDETYAPFLGSLGFHDIPQDDLLVFAGELAWRIRLARAVPALGFYPRCEPHDRERLTQLIAEKDALDRELSEIEAARRQGDLSMNEKAQARMRMKEVNGKIDRTVAEIKEICNGQ